MARSSSSFREDADGNVFSTQGNQLCRAGASTPWSRNSWLRTNTLEAGKGCPPNFYRLLILTPPAGCPSPEGKESLGEAGASNIALKEADA